MKPKTLLLTLVLLLLPGIAVLLQSCGCDEIIDYCHSIKTFNLTPVNNAGSEPIPVGDSGVIAKALLFELELTENIEVCRHYPSNPFLQQAIAFTKPDCTKDKYQDTIKKVHIYADKDFDQQYRTGVDLSPLFVTPDTNDLLPNGFKVYTSAKYKYYLMSEPTDTGRYIFTFNVIFANGKYIDVVSEPIKLLK